MSKTHLLQEIRSMRFTELYGRLCARCAPVDEVTDVPGLFKIRYDSFTVKHLHEKLTGEHSVQLLKILA